MSLIADVLMIAGGFGAALYCWVLSRRLSRFNDLERGVGGAVAVLSAQVDDLTKALEQARATAANASKQLEETTARAEETARTLELQMASSHEPGGRRVVTGTLPSGRTVRRRRRGADTEAEAAA
ncbi:MAG: hypothetical protein AAFU80_04985 [Pseudomonadota bacterium]